MKQKIAIKWIYTAKEPQDGTRALVDSVLPHGRDFHDFDVDIWCQQVAPTSSLKRQLTKGELDWKLFTHTYREELHQQPQKLEILIEAAAQGNLTLLTAEREPEQTWLAVLKEVLEARIKSAATSRNY